MTLTVINVQNVGQLLVSESLLSGGMDDKAPQQTVESKWLVQGKAARVKILASRIWTKMTDLELLLSICMDDLAQYRFLYFSSTESHLGIFPTQSCLFF